MEEIKTFWSETMQMSEARWIVAITGLVVCVAIAFYVVKLFRDMAMGKTVDPASYISDFQKLRDEGKLDEEEYARLAKAIPKDIAAVVSGDSPIGATQLPVKPVSHPGATPNKMEEMPDFEPDQAAPAASDSVDPTKARD
jgi:hypothetical protein